MTFKKTLVITQIYIHILFLLGLCLMPLSFTIPVLIVSQIIYVGCCGTVFFHRTVSHRNDIHPLAEKILILISWLGVVSSAMAWAGVHRKHHRYSDSDKDPHSPIIMGKFKAYWQMSNNDLDVLKYVPDLLRKPWYVFQHKHYFTVLFSIHALGLAVLPMNWYWALLVVPGFLMWAGGSAINIFCHDKHGPANVTLWGILNGGEGWHKNHHEQPANPSFRHWADWGGHVHNMLKVTK